jgi:predicted ATPase
LTSPKADIAPLIAEKTEGNLFFMEEVVQTLAEEKVLEGERGRSQAAEFIYEQPAFPESEYTLKHALTQEVV